MGEIIPSLLCLVLLILLAILLAVLKIRKKVDIKLRCDFCNNAGVINGIPCPKCLDPRGPFYD